MQRTELTIKPGPSGWVEVQTWRGESIVSQAWVCFTRRRGGRWQPSALFMLPPTAEALRELSLHRIEVAVNASAVVSEELAERFKEPIAGLGTVAFLKVFPTATAITPSPPSPSRSCSSGPLAAASTTTSTRRSPMYTAELPAVRRTRAP